MIIELTPEIFFEQINKEGPLHVVMHYGATCGPCKATMPHYILLEKHFEEYNIKNVKFYTFHQWQKEYKQFIEDNNLKTKLEQVQRDYDMVKQNYDRVTAYENNIITRLKYEIKKLSRDILEKQLVIEQFKDKYENRNKLLKKVKDLVLKQPGQSYDRVHNKNGTDQNKV